ncbi:TonB-dependent siderophore receptor [Tritonibacter scottomollicae]|uniref:TonB-dependent siderophore receptor n=1 Tax=Tritonibacter scottomollicae TaxID=483013 RepID=A0ABZ0HE54_TRISK|nr:TonB-dependent siderophore receptor [Tritonibacter scottomollicae]WOI33118.1 TonB-dependent siderophore receptor [Tritonibacter scottomollicae]
MTLETPNIKGRRLRALMAGCTALIAVPSLAIAQADDELIVLEPITVQAQDDTQTLVASEVTSGSGLATDVMDTSATVSVVTAREIQQRGAQTIEQVLNYTASVVTDYYGADSRFDYFRIRGFDAYTYRDGLRVGASFGGLREEPYAFERVEVVKGGNSTTFGVSDPGGSVNFVTKTPKQGRHGEAYLSFGSFNSKEIGFDFGDDLNADGTLSYRLVGLVRDADAEWDFSRDDETYLGASIAWRPTAMTSLVFAVDRLHRDGVPGGGGHPMDTDYDASRYFGEPDFNYRGVDRTTASLMFNHEFDNGLQLGVSARYTDSASDYGYIYLDDRRNIAPGANVVDRFLFANDSSGNDFVINANLQYDASFGALDSRTLVGIEYSDSSDFNTAWWSGVDPIDHTNFSYTGGGYDLDSIAPYQVRRTDQTTKSVYLQEELTFNEQWIANFGLRYDEGETTQTNLQTGSTSSGDYGETTLRAGLLYKVTPDLSVYGSYSESVVPAGLTVEPERGRQLEAGVKYRPAGGRALLSASIYDLTKHNMTVTNPTTMMDETIGESSVRGLDLEAKVDLYRNFSIIAGYSHLDSEIVDDGDGGNEGNALQFVPSNVGSLWVNYTLEGAGNRGDMVFGLGARYTGTMWYDNANTREGDSFTVVDASFSYDIRENTNLRLNVTNLFDKKHVSGGIGANWYSPARTISATLTRTW